MKTFALAALASLLTLSTAAPTAAPIEKRFPSPPAGTSILAPHYISQSFNGRLDYDPSGAYIYWGSDNSITTMLFAFSVPSTASGKKCSLQFYLDPADSSASVGGSGLVQVFASRGAPPAEDRSDYPPGNQRDQQYGNLVLQKGGDALVNTVDGPNKLEFDCPPAGEYGFEVVPKWGVNAYWNKAVSGLYLKY